MNAAPCWDIFCKLIDNYGDIGVCWRLSCELAARGQAVRLWVDDTSALAWMAPGGYEGVAVYPWDAHTAETLATLPRADVLVEAFGCELDDTLARHYASLGTLGPSAGAQALAWINLEYLSAEAFVARCHGLPSPVLHGPATGMVKHFFYPGFTPGTGGLLREADLLQRQARFDASAWLRQLGVARGPQRLISLFCYEPLALPALLQQLATDPQPTLLLVTAGRADAAVRAALPQLIGWDERQQRAGALSLHGLPQLSQIDYDHLLWACDLNLVRGEDSLVRALWAGKPLLWHIYPQHDDAHHAKLQAFLDAIQAPPSLRQAHWAWNGVGPHSLPSLEIDAWQAQASETRARLLQQPNLASQLLGFVQKNR